MLRFLKNNLKKFLGIYYTKLIQERYNKLFRTKKYKEQIIFENKIVAFYSTFIKQNDLCFDVGANFGNRTLAFLALKAKVIAIEPQEPCSKFLRKKFGNKIILIKNALGADEQVKNMYISDNSALSSLSEDWINEVKKKRFKEFRWSKIKKVNVLTLDSLIEIYGSPDFIKIDVEGYELEVLKGLTKNFEMVSFEYTVPEQLEKTVLCLEYLKGIRDSLICNYSVGEELKFHLKSWIEYDQFMQYIRNPEFIDTKVGDIYVRNNSGTTG